MSFIHNLKHPIIGLAPIDGVTDCAYREIVDKYSKPSIMFTEFIPIEGLMRGATKLLHSFHRHKSKTPIIGQVFGVNEISFYNAFFIVAEMGLDGIDVNMGCPDRGLVKRGGGAGLILNPKQARQLIHTLKEARNDWQNGKQISDTLLPKEILTAILTYKKQNNIIPKRKTFSVSVKTRIGFDKPITKKWISYLLDAEPDLITIHGRTFKQLYTGKADWEEIQKAVKLAYKSKTQMWGNGDISSMGQAKEYIKTYDVDGILVGRAAFGNPWFFGENKPTLKTKFQVMLEHAKLYLKYRPEMSIAPLRKHFCWYCSGFPGYGKVREKLMKTLAINEIKNIVDII